MTRDEIMNMPAGREMDRLIAEKIMGLSVYDGERKIVRYEGFHGQHKRIYTIPEIYVRVSGVANYSCDSYSTDVKYAWNVIDKLTRFSITIESFPKGVLCRFFDAGQSTTGDAVGWADTAPLAICRAALLAVEAV